MKTDRQDVLDIEMIEIEEAKVLEIEDLLPEKKGLNFDEVAWELIKSRNFQNAKVVSRLGNLPIPYIISCVELGNRTEALDGLESVKEEVPTVSQQFFLGEMYTLLGEFDEAMEAYSYLIRNPAPQEAFVKRAGIKNLLGDYGSAVEDLQNKSAFERIEDSKWEDHLVWAEAWLGLGEYKYAAREIRKAKRNPKERSNGDLIRRCSAAGEIYMRQGRFKDALKEFSSGLNLFIYNLPSTSTLIWAGKIENILGLNNLGEKSVLYDQAIVPKETLKKFY